MEVLDDNISEGCLFPFGTLDEVVQVVDVGLVMFVVVVVESLRGDDVGEGVFGVGKVRQHKGHVSFLILIITDS